MSTWLIPALSIVISKQVLQDNRWVLGRLKTKRTVRFRWEQVQ